MPDVGVVKSPALPVVWLWGVEKSPAPPLKWFLVSVPELMVLPVPALWLLSVLESVADFVGQLVYGC